MIIQFEQNELQVLATLLPKLTLALFSYQLQPQYNPVCIVSLTFTFFSMISTMHLTR